MPRSRLPLSTWAALVAIASLATGCRPDRPPIETQASPPLPAVHARPLTDVRFERTVERVERGRYLADAAIGCVLCHSERDVTLPGSPPVAGREYAGAILEERPGYRLVAPNLSSDPETGAGAWSDDMLARAIREGVGHDGRGIGGRMWWWAFRALSDDDVAAIVVYLRSRPPVRNPLPPRLLSIEQEKERSMAARPLTAPVPLPDLSTPIERGRYLISIADCMGCHSPWEAPIQAGVFSGGNQVAFDDRPVWSANITPDPLALGAWTPAMFRARIRTGRGGTADPTMPWVAYRGMTDDDLDAIFAALADVPPVTHLVNNADLPTPCPVCGQAHPAGELNRAPVYERVEIDRSLLEACAGTFHNADYDLTLKITFDGTTLRANEGRGDIETVPVAGGWLRGHGLSAPLRCERGADGRVDALLLHDLGVMRLERRPADG